MCAKIVNLDWTEGIKPDMQRHKADRDALAAQTFKEFRSKMQARRWSRR